LRHYFEYEGFDAEGKTFGRILTEAATYLRGKHKPSFTPHVDCGDYVVIINAKKAKFSGNKLEDKEYFRHSGYFGSTKRLPKTNLGRAMLKKLKVYEGSEHPHTAQIGKGN